MTKREIIKTLIECFRRNNTVFICGNGGSASQANHFAAEFVGKYTKHRRALPAVSLSANPAILTAVANDLGYTYVFSRQIEALGKKDDVLITLSTSGRSMNIHNAVIAAKQHKLIMIDFPRDKGKDVGEIQNYQLELMHDIVREVEKQFV